MCRPVAVLVFPDAMNNSSTPIRRLKWLVEVPMAHPPSGHDYSALQADKTTEGLRPVNFSLVAEGKINCFVSGV